MTNSNILHRGIVSRTGSNDREAYHVGYLGVGDDEHEWFRDLPDATKQQYELLKAAFITCGRNMRITESL